MDTKKRGNDILNQKGHNADTFEHYLGPFGSDVRQSIKGPTVNNQDALGGQQVQKVGKGSHGPAFRKNRGGSQY